MQPELGNVEFVGRVEQTQLCVGVLANERGLGLVSVHQDSRADRFWWQSMVALLSLWEHTGMERYKTWE